MGATLMSPESEFESLRREAVCVASEADLARALDRMAREIESRLSQGPVLMLCIMNGGLVVAAELLKRLRVELQLDFVRVGRYGDATQGRELQWKVEPEQELAGASIILVDDIFDEGVTLDAVVSYCRDRGARQVISAVLVDKLHTRKKPLWRPDVVGVQLPDHYLFGFGMDYKGYLRNCSAIYALPDTALQSDC